MQELVYGVDELKQRLIQMWWNLQGC